MKISELTKRLTKKEVVEMERQLPYQLSMFIFEARLNGRFSQKGLAKKMKTKQPAISRLEAGYISPSIRTLEKIAKACKGHLQIKFIPNPHTIK